MVVLVEARYESLSSSCHSLSATSTDRLHHMIQYSVHRAPIFQGGFQEGCTRLGHRIRLLVIVPAGDWLYYGLNPSRCTDQGLATLDLSQTRYQRPTDATF